MVKKGNRRKLTWVERCLVFYRTRIFYTIVPEERPNQPGRFLKRKYLSASTYA